MSSIHASILAFLFFAGCIDASAQAVVERAAIKHIMSSSNIETQLFCGVAVLTSGEVYQAQSNLEMRGALNGFNALAKNQYFVMTTEGETNWAPPQRYIFTPTAKLWAIADRRDNKDCFYFRSPTTKNVRIARIEKHPLEQRMYRVFATYMLEYTPFMRLFLTSMGTSPTANKRMQMVMVEDPYTSEYKVIEKEVTEGTP